jgi:hypothetical protein
MIPKICRLFGQDHASRIKAAEMAIQGNTGKIR